MEDEFTFFRPEVEACAAIQHFYGGRFDEAARLIASATPVADRGPDPTVPMEVPPTPRSDVVDFAAGNSWLIGGRGCRRSHCQGWSRRALVLGPFSECFALVGGVVSGVEARHDAALAAASSLIELARFTPTCFGNTSAFRSGSPRGEVAMPVAPPMRLHRRSLWPRQ
jgi:hypothetical protein